MFGLTKIVDHFLMKVSFSIYYKPVKSKNNQTKIQIFLKLVLSPWSESNVTEHPYNIQLWKYDWVNANRN